MVRIRFKVVISVLFMLILILGGWVVYMKITSWINTDPQEEALQLTRQFLMVAQNHPIGPLPKTELPSYLWVDEDWWGFFQEAMARNGSQYTLKVRRNPSIPNPESSSIEFLVLISFPQGRQAELSFYRGGVSGCGTP